MLLPMNIWQIGRTILAMMELTDSPPIIDYHVNLYVVAPLVAQLHNHTYSHALNSLVNDCLQVDPMYRPTPAAPLASCTAEIAANHAADLNRAGATPYGPSNSRRLRLRNDRIRIGLGQ